MTAYYNEIDPYNVTWLKELISAGAIAPGDVDNRSIEDVTPNDLRGYVQCHFFAGIGVWSYALRQSGWSDDRPIWTGSCPCFPADTLILTTKGLIEIQNIKIGDLVLTHKGRFRPVTHTGHDFSETITIKGQGHWGLKTTPLHPFFSKNQKRDNKRGSATYGRVVLDESPAWTASKDMLGKRWASVASIPEVKRPPFSGTAKGYFFDKYLNKYRVKGEKNKHPIYIGVYDTEEEACRARSKAIIDKKIDVRGADSIDMASVGFARFLGYWLGDGWTCKNTVFLCGAKEDVDFLNNIFSEANLPGKAYLERTSSRIRCGSKSLVAWLSENFGEGAERKRIPIWLYGMSSEYRAAFLQGYAEADGCINTQKKGGQTYQQWTTVSKKIAVGLRILLNIDKKAASIKCYLPLKQRQIEHRNINEKRCYQVCSYETTRSFQSDDLHGWGLVKSIAKNSTIEKVWNLAVAEDNSYSADGIIVHNCQPFSAAGKGKGFADERHLWPSFHWLIKQCRPETVMGEQVAGQNGEAWLDLVQDDLEGENYSVRSAVTAACGFGAPHIRKRIYWVAYACQQPGKWNSRTVSRQKEKVCRERDFNGSQFNRYQYGCADGSLADNDSKRFNWESISIRSEQGENIEASGSRKVYAPGPVNGHWKDVDWLFCRDGLWRPVESLSESLADGIADSLGYSSIEGRYSLNPLTDSKKEKARRIMRLKGYGNAIVAQQAMAFIESIMEDDR